jgi:hypothetical protein
MVIQDGATKKVLCTDCHVVIGRMAADTHDGMPGRKSFAERVGEEHLEKSH